MNVHLISPSNDCEFNLVNTTHALKRATAISNSNVSRDRSFNWFTQKETERVREELPPHFQIKFKFVVTIQAQFFKDEKKAYSEAVSF